MASRVKSHKQGQELEMSGQQTQALREAVQASRDDLIDLCQRMIRTQSLPGQESEAANLILCEMQKLGYDDAWIDEVGNVVGVIRGSGGGRSLMLNTHLDHVDAGDQSGWQHPPFGGEIADGSIWGRAAVDIKGPTAAQIYGAAALRTAGVRSSGDVFVAVAVQEELGGLGSVELARTTRTDRAVVGEPSSNVLRRGHKGRIELIVAIRGRSCHASMPDKGINPHYSLARFVTSLRDIQLMEDQFLGSETLVPSLIYSDQTSANVVPGELRLHIDWRTVPARGAEEIRKEIERVLKASLGEGATGDVRVREFRLRTHTGAERDVPAAFPSMVIAESDPLVTRSRDALQDAFGREMPVTRWDFATDGGHLTAAGIPTVGFGPGDEALAHTNVERISIKELVEACLGYAVLSVALTERE